MEGIWDPIYTLMTKPKKKKPEDKKSRKAMEQGSGKGGKC